MANLRRCADILVLYLLFVCQSSLKLGIIIYTVHLAGSIYLVTVCLSTLHKVPASQ